MGTEVMQVVSYFPWLVRRIRRITALTRRGRIRRPPQRSGRCDAAASVTTATVVTPATAAVTPAVVVI